MNKAHRKKLKAQMGYEKSPASCSSCSYMLYQQPPNTTPKLPFCNYGKFFTTTNSVCDLWEDKTGNTLEGQPAVNPIQVLAHRLERIASE